MNDDTLHNDDNKDDSSGDCDNGNLKNLNS